MNFTRTILVTLLVFGCTSTPAQDAQPQFLAVTAVKVNPGNQAAFEAFLARYKAAADKVGSELTWAVSTNAMGPPTSYTISTGWTSFGEAANPPNPAALIDQAFGEGEGAAAIAGLQGVVKKTEGRAWRIREDLGRPVESEEQPVGIIVLFIDVNPGAQAAFEAYGKKIKEASEKLDEGNWSSFVGMPGAPSEYLVTIPIFDWKALDTPQARPIPVRLAAAFGESEGAKIYADGIAAIADITTSMIRARPDLSRPPAE
jgi:hypothetical protein